MIYSMFSIAGKRDLLAGSTIGRQALAAMIEEAKPVSEPMIAFLDFANVKVATGSFLREAVVGFRDFSRSAISNLYPVVANPNEMIEEELSIYLRDRNDAMWACDLGGDAITSAPRLLGALDAAQRATLQLITEHKRISAPELAKLRPNEGVGTTAWNNRLSTLASKGIIFEIKAGKCKSFSPVLEAV